MTYPPNNPGYPVSQQPGGYGVPGGVPGPGPGPGGGPVAPAYPAASGAAKMPSLLSGAVAALGLAAYLASFGPLLRINADIGPFGGASFTASGLSYWTIAALTAALLAAVSLLPRSKADGYTPIVAVTAALGVLLVIGQIINRPNGFAVGWALWLVLLLTVFQAVVAVTALLFQSGVLAAPAPRPQYGQYGQYPPAPAGYYGQPGGQPQGQRPGYPAPYGYPAGGLPTGDTDAPDTPPAGIPGYQPPSTPSATEPTQGSGSAQS